MRDRIFPLALLSVAALALPSCALTPEEAARAADAKAKTQADLDQTLAGLTATDTSTCAPTTLQPSSLKAYGSTLVYTVTRKLKYVNRTSGGCETIENGDILVTVSPSGRLCRGDIGRTVMPTSRVPTGSCSLGDFVTYRAK